MDDLKQLQTRCVAHEIRNHVSICEMYSEIIRKNLERDGYSNQSIDNALECIRKSLQIITTTLIDLKSINTFEERECDLKYITEEGCRLAQAYIHGKDIKLEYIVKDTCKILIDENKFLACIVNIVKNAIEAIENRGEIMVIADVKNDLATIRISNNGKMISKSKQKEIFEEGYTTKATGSGLGLHICQQNLKAQKATLKLNKSTKNITEFEITIPIHR